MLNMLSLNFRAHHPYPSLIAPRDEHHDDEQPDRVGRVEVGPNLGQWLTHLDEVGMVYDA